MQVLCHDRAGVEHERNDQNCQTAEGAGPTLELPTWAPDDEASHRHRGYSEAILVVACARITRNSLSFNYRRIRKTMYPCGVFVVFCCVNEK